MDYSCSCLLFYWGVRGNYDNLAAHTFIISTDLDENLKRIFDGRLIEDPSIYLHIPSKVDPDMAPPGCASFYVLTPVSDPVCAQHPWNEEVVDGYRQKALATLSALPGLEDLQKNIISESIFTPEDFKAHFNAYRGSTFGLQPTLRQSNHWRPQPKSKRCEGLYFTGSSVHPAPAPIVIESSGCARWSCGATTRRTAWHEQRHESSTPCGLLCRSG